MFFAFIIITCCVTLQCASICAFFHAHVYVFRCTCFHKCVRMPQCMSSRSSILGFMCILCFRSFPQSHHPEWQRFSQLGRQLSAEQVRSTARREGGLWHRRQHSTGCLPPGPKLPRTCGAEHNSGQISYRVWSGD